MYPGETLYREKNPSKQFPFIAKIMYDHLQNIHHENSTLKELAKLTLT
jgi:hypothetical protein